MKKVLLFLILPLLVISLAIMWFLILREKNQALTSIPSPTEKPLSTPAISLNSLNQDLKKISYKVSFQKLPDPPPTAIELNLTFDPQILKLESFQEGNLWEVTNVLEKTVNNEEGSAAVSLGQGFGAKVTSKTTVITAEFSLLDPSVKNPEIAVAAESFMARTGEGKLISLQNLLVISKI